MRYKLKDLAKIERAKKDKEYQSGATLVQLSASRGQVIWYEGGPVDTRYCVIVLKDESVMKSKFLYYYIKNTMPRYLEIIQTGINIQIDEIENYPVVFPIIEEMR